MPRDTQLAQGTLTQQADPGCILHVLALRYLLGLSRNPFCYPPVGHMRSHLLPDPLRLPPEGLDHSVSSVPEPHAECFTALPM